MFKAFTWFMLYFLLTTRQKREVWYHFSPVLVKGKISHD